MFCVCVWGLLRECWGLWGGVFLAVLFGFTDMFGMAVKFYEPDAPVAPDNMRFKPVFRGVPEDYEFLTDQGWIRFDDMLASNSLGLEVPWVGNQGTTPGYGVSAWRGGVFQVKPGFPKVASVDPSTGRVVFSPVQFFQWFDFSGRLVRVKMKGVDLMVHPHTDLWLHPRYGRGWRYVVAEDVARMMKVPQMKYGLLNKASHDLYGDVSLGSILGDSLSLPVYDGSEVLVQSSDLGFSLEHPIRVSPTKHVSRAKISDNYDNSELDEWGRRKVYSKELREVVRVCNFVVRPYHNLIVRRGRKDENPRTPWVGGPVVIGDSLDKSLLRIGGVLNEDYRSLHPEWRTASAKDAWVNNADYGDARHYGGV